jgi:hypothetical protein
VRFQRGKLTTPFGTEFVGFIITIGGVTDPSTISRTYEDIDAIFKSNPEKFKTHEEKDGLGRFKSYAVSTS